MTSKNRKINGLLVFKTRPTLQKIQPATTFFPSPLYPPSGVGGALLAHPSLEWGGVNHDQFFSISRSA